MTEDALLLIVSEQLDTAMHDADLTHRSLAERSNLNPNTVLRVSKGYNSRLSTLAALAEATGCDVELRFIRRKRNP